MVRNYKKKNTESHLQWSDENMANAIREVQAGQLSVYSAGKKYGIPQPTRCRHFKNPIAVMKVGRTPILTPAEEEEIIMTCTIFGEWGFGLSRQEIINVVSEIIKSIHCPTTFKNGTPESHWWNGFMRRHPELTKQKPQSLQMVRAKAGTKERVDHWFYECLNHTLEKLDLFEKPQCIWFKNLFIPSLPHNPRWTLISYFI